MKRNQPAKAGTKPRDGAQQKSVLKQIDELNRMSMEQLRKRWVDLFGADPGRFGRNYLIRRLGLVSPGPPSTVRGTKAGTASAAAAADRLRKRRRVKEALVVIECVS